MWEQLLHENEEEQDHHHHHGPIGAWTWEEVRHKLPGMQPQQQQQQQQEDAAAMRGRVYCDPLHTKDDLESSSTTCHTATLAELP
jgi:hypothetical protein